MRLPCAVAELSTRAISGRRDGRGKPRLPGQTYLARHAYCDTRPIGAEGHDSQACGPVWLEKSTFLERRSGLGDFFFFLVEAMQDGALENGSRLTRGQPGPGLEEWCTHARGNESAPGHAAAAAACVEAPCARLRWCFGRAPPKPKAPAVD